MNTENCTEGYFTDQIFWFDNPTGTCNSSVAAFITVGVFLMLSKCLLAVLHVRSWRRRQRKLYAKVDRRKHHPFVPSLSVLGAIVYLLFFPLAFANVINAQNGWSYAIHTLGWLAFGIVSIFFFLKIVRLGRKLIPIVQEKKRIEMHAQQLRAAGFDDEDPPTWSSAARQKNFGSFAANPMYDEDPPTYDDSSSQNGAIPPSDIDQGRGYFGTGVATGKLIFEKKMAHGKMIIGKQMANGRMIFGKRPPPQKPLNRKVSNLQDASPPPKNPMWEEDPPTTYSILEIVEPQIDRLRKLDLIGQLFFLLEVVAVVGQFLIFFFVATFAYPNDYSVAKIGFAFQAYFLFQHALSMNWQFGRVIHALKSSRRKSRRSENLETGLRKMRRQQLTIFVLASICGTIYIILTIGVVPPHWWLQALVMFFEVFANTIIHQTFVTRLKGKINEMKKQKKAAAAASGQNQVGVPASPGDNPAAGGAAGVIARVGGSGGNKDAHQQSPADHPKIIKSQVHHVRESAAFATSDSSRKDEKDDAKSAAVSW
jgi:hypothetical protein